MTMRLVERFVQLFDGNRAAVGTEEGGCRRLADPYDWELEIEGHLRVPDCAVGVYPMVSAARALGHFDDVNRWYVKWGCIDFDLGEEESWVHALNVYQALSALGVPSFIERSRSKGYHVWVFADEWVEASTMREALLAACQIVVAPTTEINPKQSGLKPGQLGNYVRLPYPGALSGPIYPPDDGLHRRVVVTSTGEPLSLRAFLESVRTVGQEALELVASYYVEPITSTLPERDWSNLSGPAIERLRGKARIIFDDGPLENAASETGFRGHTLWKLACIIAEDGQHTPDEALELLIDADQRWGKFSTRPDGELRLKQMVQRAFTV